MQCSQVDVQHAVLRQKGRGTYQEHSTLDGKNRFPFYNVSRLSSVVATSFQSCGNSVPSGILGVLMRLRSYKIEGFYSHGLNFEMFFTIRVYFLVERC